MCRGPSACDTSYPWKIVKPGIARVCEALTFAAGLKMQGQLCNQHRRHHCHQHHHMYIHLHIINMCMYLDIYMQASTYVHIRSCDIHMQTYAFTCMYADDQYTCTGISAFSHPSDYHHRHQLNHHNYHNNHRYHHLHWHHAFLSMVPAHDRLRSAPLPPPN